MCVCASIRIRVQKCFFRAARAHADIFFKNVYTVKLMEDRPVSVYKVKCLQDIYDYGGKSP